MAVRGTPVELPNADKYLSVVRQLPRPTRGQTFRFIWFVADAHSWYKHLPWERKVPFMFHLDPHAGMSRVCSRTGEWSVVPLMDDDPDKFHYTWQTTETYLKRLGHWIYHSDYGGSTFTTHHSAPGTGISKMSSMAATGGRILDESGEWIEVPRSVQEAGTAYLNAYINPRTVGFWGEETPRDKNDEQAIEKVQNRFRLLTEPFRQAVQERVQQRMENPDRSLDMWPHPDSEETDEEWEARLRTMGATDSEVEAVFLAFQSELIQQNLRGVKEEDLPGMQAAVFRRIQQLEDMRDATLRVLRLVYGD